MPTVESSRLSTRAVSRPGPPSTVSRVPSFASSGPRPHRRAAVASPAAAEAVGAAEAADVSRPGVPEMTSAWIVPVIVQPGFPNDRPQSAATSQNRASANEAVRRPAREPSSSRGRGCSSRRGRSRRRSACPSGEYAGSASSAGLSVSRRWPDAVGVHDPHVEVTRRVAVGVERDLSARRVTTTGSRRRCSRRSSADAGSIRRRPSPRSAASRCGRS